MCMRRYRFGNDSARYDWNCDRCRQLGDGRVSRLPLDRQCQSSRQLARGYSSTVHHLSRLDSDHPTDEFDEDDRNSIENCDNCLSTIRTSISRLTPLLDTTTVNATDCSSRVNRPSSARPIKRFVNRREIERWMRLSLFGIDDRWRFDPRLFCTPFILSV